ncbi:hypothetical protein GCM10010433_26980 [Streptomyces pulveraceus]
MYCYVLREPPGPEQGLYVDRFGPHILQRREDLAPASEPSMLSVTSLRSTSPPFPTQT